MEVFVHRDPTGYTMDEVENVQELQELLSSGNYGPLSDSDEVTMEIRAPWTFIRDLLCHPFFAELWFNPKEKR
jgi:hypothetical protein